MSVSVVDLCVGRKNWTGFLTMSPPWLSGPITFIRATRSLVNNPVYVPQRTSSHSRPLHFSLSSHRKGTFRNFALIEKRSLLETPWLTSIDDQSCASRRSSHFLRRHENSFEQRLKRGVSKGGQATKRKFNPTEKRSKRDYLKVHYSPPA